VKRLALLALLALACAVGARTGSAQTRYVSDQLKVGIHAGQTLDSPILALVASGTALEELRRAGELVQVRTPDGITGWVDGAYLASNPPAEVRARQALTALDQSRSELAKLQASDANLVKRLKEGMDKTRGELARARASNADLAERLKAMDKTRGELARVQASNADLAERLKEMEDRAHSAEKSLLASQREEAPKARAAEAAATATSEALREIQHLAEQNQQLKQRVAELEAVQTMAAEQPPATSSRPDPGPPQPMPRLGPALPSDNPYATILAWEAWVWLLLGSMGLLALALGAYLVDWNLRRRHGGFRI